jgi:predicted protein tyrosine phosphatase/2'-5' RNA ligase
MILAVVAYPALDDADRHRIESFRAKHDPQSERIGAHFTLVFPVEIAPGEIVPDLDAVARSTGPIDCSVHRASVVADSSGAGSHIFLVADQGATAISALHDRLYAGSLQPHLCPDIPFIPHITVGAARDSTMAMKLAEDLDAGSRVVTTVIDRLDLVEISALTVRSMEVFPLSGVDGAAASRRKLNVLFVCSRNQWRSPTAERMWRKSPSMNVRSAGTSASARRVVSSRDLEWADVVFVMEPRHREVLRERFQSARRDVRIEVLDIPDQYEFMDGDLVELLRTRVGELLGEPV